MADFVLESVSLCKKYGNINALSDLNLRLPEGRIIGLLGPNGSGKTTFIKLAAGLLSPSSGNIFVNGIPVGEKTKALVSYLPERTYFDESCTVIDTLDLFEDFYSDFDRCRAEEMLRLLQVPFDRKIKTLSKGTKEKVQLVLVMSRRAKLYLLDEPIGGVDPAVRDYVLSTVVSSYEPTSTILISTHLIADVEQILDDFIFIRDGQLVMYMPCSEVREKQGMSIDAFFRETFRYAPIPPFTKNFRNEGGKQ